MTDTNNIPAALGPLEHQEQAWQAAAHVHGASSTQARTEYITDQLEAAGLELGNFDRRIARWVGTWEAETVATVLSWVYRGRTAGQDALREEISDLNARTASLEAAAYVHALPGIDLPGRLAGAHRGPRCGAQDGRTALFAADVTCPACIADMAKDGGAR